MENIDLTTTILFAIILGIFIYHIIVIRQMIHKTSSKIDRLNEFFVQYVSYLKEAVEIDKKKNSKEQEKEM